MDQYYRQARRERAAWCSLPRGAVRGEWGATGRFAHHNNSFLIPFFCCLDILRASGCFMVCQHPPRLTPVVHLRGFHLSNTARKYFSLQTAAVTPLHHETTRSYNLLVNTGRYSVVQETCVILQTDTCYFCCLTLNFSTHCSHSYLVVISLQIKPTFCLYTS